MKASFPKRSLNIGVIADESTVTGFLLTGIGARDKDGKGNFLICDKQTTDSQLEDAFARMLNDHFGVVLISQ